MLHVCDPSKHASTMQFKHYLKPVGLVSPFCQDVICLCRNPYSLLGNAKLFIGLVRKSLQIA